MRPIRVGLVGANADRGWARDAHLEALRSVPDYSIAAVSARNQQNAEQAARYFGAEKAFGDTLAMVRDPSVELVVVTVKVPEHRAIVLAALEAGKHVYCEWPLGKDVLEAEEMAAAVTPAAQNVIGLQCLSAPVIRQASRMIAGGAIGRPRILRAFSAAAAWGSETTDFNAYLQDKHSGATLETIGGGHTLAAIEALVGSYVEVDARCTTLQKRVFISGTSGSVERTCADHMLVLGGHETGCVSTLEVLGGTSEKPVLFEVQGENGWLKVTGAVPGMCQIAPLVLESSAPLPPPIEPAVFGMKGPPVNLAEVYVRLAGDLRTGTHTLPTFDDAVDLTRLLRAIGTASLSGQRQKI